MSKAATGARTSTEAVAVATRAARMRVANWNEGERISLSAANT